MSDRELGYVQALARDYLCHVLRRPAPRPGPARVSRLLRAVASAVQSDAERALRPSLDGLDVASVGAARAVFQAVVRQEFADGVVNWGRLVTVFALQGILAKKLLCARVARDPDPDRDRDRDRDLDLDADTTEEIACFVAEFITAQAGDWIRQNGGWVNSPARSCAEPGARGAPAALKKIYTRRLGVSN